MNALEASLYGTLTGGTALMALLATNASVYAYAVPHGAAYPAVMFNLMGGGDANETRRRRKDVLYQIKGISRASMKAAGDIDAQIDDLLYGHTLTVSGWTNYWSARERDIAYTEVTPEGRLIWHCGGIYRFRLCE